MTETVTASDFPAAEAIASIRRTALLFLGYALACAARAGLSPEEAAQLFKELRPQRGKAIGTADELDDFAREEARFMALLHGRVTLERKGTGWSFSVPLDQDRGVIESFTTLEHYVRWGGEFDRELRPGLRWDTWLGRDTYRFETDRWRERAQFRFDSQDRSGRRGSTARWWQQCSSSRTTADG